MIASVLATAAVFQYGSCQSGGPDRSRTAPEAAHAYVQGLAARDPGPIRWVTRPGTVWRSPTATVADEVFYESLRPNERPNQYPVIVGMTGTRGHVAIVTRLRGVEGSEALTVLTIEGGCIIDVQLF